ncbi:hypothetical protein EVAR_7975_1 [Eumeta japonica]|uniref:Uncharacterized protein n=1 Tax=Eumeta variegata TaxID=151549 RepID=A0A4C1TKC0_EUMVA|nr:hypothetical protein EVAR_7975_1 [Eumeta japonica]
MTRPVHNQSCRFRELSRPTAGWPGHGGAAATGEPTRSISDFDSIGAAYQRIFIRDFDRGHRSAVPARAPARRRPEISCRVPISNGMSANAVAISIDTNALRPRFVYGYGGGV